MLIRCPSCQARVRVDPSLSAKAFRCPGCRTVLRLKGEATDPRATPPPAEPASASQRQRLEKEEGEEERIHFLVSSHGPYLLTADRPVYFGRDRSCELWLDDARASRKHAELAWSEREQAFRIRDLDSRNGTDVNEEAVGTHRLENGDTISIAGFPFHYRIVDSMGEVREAVKEAREEEKSGDTAEVASLSTMAESKDLSGTLDSIGVAEICQLLRLGNRSGRLTLMDDAKTKALLDFQHGQVTRAEYGQKAGEEAVLAAFGLRNGLFTFQGGAPSEERNVSRATDSLLLEAARRQDEGA